MPDNQPTPEEIEAAAERVDESQRRAQEALGRHEQQAREAQGSNQPQTLAKAHERIDELTTENARLAKAGSPHLAADLERTEAALQRADAAVLDLQTKLQATEARADEAEEKLSAAMTEASLSPEQIRGAARASLYEEAFAQLGVKVDASAPAKEIVAKFRAHCKTVASAEAMQIVCAQGADYALPVSGQQPGQPATGTAQTLTEKCLREKRRGI